MSLAGGPASQAAPGALSRASRLIGGRRRAGPWLMRLLSGIAHRAAVARIDRAGDYVLEIGAGAGRSMERVGIDVGLIGVEEHERSARLADARWRRRGAGVGLGFVRAGYAALPFADGMFDTALASFVLGGVADPAAIIAELVRVVRPGGEIVVLDVASGAAGKRRPGCDGRSPEGPERDAAAASRLDPFVARPGLSLVASRPLPPLGLFAIVAFRREATAGTAPGPASEDERGARLASGGRRRRSRGRAAFRPRRRR